MGIVDNLSSLSDEELSFNKKAYQQKKKTKKKVTKKTTKKRKSKMKVDEMSPKMNQGMLKEAIDDINREIARINLQKRKLNQQISDADSGLELSRRAEKRLQDKIADLLEKEASLKEKKKRITVDEESLSDKLLKIQKIRSELNDV